MITIQTVQKENMFILKIDGHADFAPAGQDLVCAGVTTLAYTLAQIVTQMQEENNLLKKPEIFLKNGRAGVTFTVKNSYYEFARYSFNAVVTGFRVLAHNYPDCIKLLYSDSSTNGQKGQ